MKKCGQVINFFIQHTRLVKQTLTVTTSFLVIVVFYSILKGQKRVSGGRGLNGMYRLTAYRSTDEFVNNVLGGSTSGM